jgi:hypothetical protein
LFCCDKFSILLVGHAAANAVARLGALLSPFLIEGSSRSMSLWQIGVVMLLVHTVAVLCVSQLPETKGRRLGHAGSDEVEEEPPTTSLHIPERALFGEYHHHTICDEEDDECAAAEDVIDGECRTQDG